MRYAIIKADGTHEVIDSVTRLDYHKLQELVAAPDERSPAFEVIGGPNLSIYINENGKYLQLETNEVVTQFARANRLIWQSDAVKGDCIITGEPDDEGNSKDVNDVVLKAILSYS